MVSEKGQGQEERLRIYDVWCHVGNHGNGVGGQPPWESAIRSNSFLKLGGFLQSEKETSPVGFRMDVSLQKQWERPQGTCGVRPYHKGHTRNKKWRTQVSTTQLNHSLTLLGIYMEYSGRGVIAFSFLRNKHAEQKPPQKYPTQINSETNI